MLMYLKNVLGLFFLRNVDDILDQLTTTLGQLDESAEKHIALMERHQTKAVKYDALAAKAEQEAARAMRVSDRVRQLID